MQDLASARLWLSLPPAKQGQYLVGPGLPKPWMNCHSAQGCGCWKINVVVVAAAAAVTSLPFVL